MSGVSRKRNRVSTPVKSGKAGKLMDDINAAFIEVKDKLQEEITNLEDRTIKDMKKGLVVLFNRTLIPYMEKTATQVSDLAQEVERLESALEEQDTEDEGRTERILELENLREKERLGYPGPRWAGRWRRPSPR